MISIRIIDATIFRRAHAPIGADFHDCTAEEAAVLIGTGRAVRIQASPIAPAPAAVRETAQALPIVEVPEHRAQATPSFALQAEGGSGVPSLDAADPILTPPKRTRKPRAPKPETPPA